MRAYAYIDGENHCTLAETQLRASSGIDSVSDVIIQLNGKSNYTFNWPIIKSGTERYIHDPKIRFFWDNTSFNQFLGSSRFAEVKRAVYATALVGDAERIHSANVQLRDRGFEPIVLVEEKKFGKQRERLLRSDGVLQKPKGCDMALVTRMVSDAAANLYDVCILYTSDSDFLPAIKAVQSMGKIVFVYGYDIGLMKRSEFLHVPDKFINLGGELDSDVDQISKIRQIWRHEKQS